MASAAAQDLRGENAVVTISIVQSVNTVVFTFWHLQEPATCAKPAPHVTAQLEKSTDEAVHAPEILYVALVGTAGQFK